MEIAGSPTLAILLPAAGSGSRMGKPVNKLLLELAGEPIIVHTVRAISEFAKSLEANPLSANGTTYQQVQLLLIVRPDEIESFQKILKHAGLDSVVAGYTAGGSTRQESVYLGLQALLERGLTKDTPTLVHDAARCLVSERILHETALLAASGLASAPALPVNDTLRRINVDTEGLVHYAETVDRENAVQMQTPQAAPLHSLIQVHEEAAHRAVSVTDDVALLQEGGYAVRMVTGELKNLKITRPEDLQYAEQLLKG